MQTLILGFIIFFGVHTIPSLSIKRKLIDRLGKTAYLVLFSLFSAFGLGLIVYGKGHAGFIEIWSPPTWSRLAPLFIMWPVFILLSWAYLPCQMKKRLRHPMLFGVILFSFSHLIANGDLASILLFGAFALFSLLKVVNARHQSKPSEILKKSFIWDFTGIVIGSVAYFLSLKFHQQIAGIAI